MGRPRLAQGTRIALGRGGVTGRPAAHLVLAPGRALGKCRIMQPSEASLAMEESWRWAGATQTMERVHLRVVQLPGSRLIARLQIGLLGLIVRSRAKVATRHGNELS